MSFAPTTQKPQHVLLHTKLIFVNKSKCAMRPFTVDCFAVITEVGIRLEIMLHHRLVRDMVVRSRLGT